MKNFALFLIFLAASCTTAQKPNPKNTSAMQTLHQLSATDINGRPFDFSSLKGKKVLIVNTASECGLTPQYEQLQQLHLKYGEKVAIIGFPSNDFAGQEPGSEQEIAQFCSKNYGVTFPLMSKVTVKGEGMHPVYEFLTQKSKNGLQDSEVSWNFQKYLIDEQGKLVKVVSPRTLPDDAEIMSWIKG